MTTQPRPFRFGAKAVKAGSAKEWTDIVRQVEDLGYESFHMDDHFGNQLGVVPALMAAADATSSILVGPHVAGVDFRNPVLFAKECATIDLLSEGRFTLGIGAGWSEKDYAIAGIHQDNALTRIGRLREAVQIMKGLWADGPFSFDGEHYRVAEVDAVPKPVLADPDHDRRGRPEDPRPGRRGGRHRRDQPEDRRPHDQPRIDGHGRRRRHGREGRGGACRRRRPVRRARAAGADLQDGGHRPTRAGRRAARPRRSGCRPTWCSSAPFFQIGSVEQITEDLQAMRERWGISYILFQSDGVVPMAPVVAQLAGT